MLEPKKLIKQFGMSDKESEVFLALLELGDAQPAQISRKSGIKRPTAYVLLGSLVEKGFVTQVVGKKKVFRAEDPKKLLLRTRESLAQIEQSLPWLMSLMNQKNPKPTVRFYSKLEGIKQAYEESLLLPPGSELLAFGSAGAVMNRLSGFIESYLKRRVQQNIRVRAITGSDQGGKLVAGRDKKELRETRFLPSSLLTQDIEIDIYGNKLLAISLENEELIAILLESKTLVDAFRQMFEIMWNTVATSK